MKTGVICTSSLFYATRMNVLEEQLSDQLNETKLQYARAILMVFDELILKEINTNEKNEQ